MLLRDGIHSAVYALGDSVLRRMVSIMRRRHFATPFTNVLRMKVAATRKSEGPFVCPTAIQALLRGTGHSAGAVTTRVDDIVARGRWGIMEKARACLIERLGIAEIQRNTFTYRSMRLSQPQNFARGFAGQMPKDDSQFLPAPEELW